MNKLSSQTEGRRRQMKVIRTERERQRGMHDGRLDAQQKAGSLANYTQITLTSVSPHKAHTLTHIFFVVVESLNSKLGFENFL